MMTTVKRWLAGLLIAAGALSLASAQTGQAPAQEHLYSQEQLDQMLAPIALYPDQLLTQILMAATYPLEVVKAARWSRAHPGLEGDEAVRAAANEDWDPSVKSLVAFPRLLAMMDERIDWTEQLGEAFLAQEPYVLETIQSLRRRAYDAGNLRSNTDALVTEEGSSILIAPASPTVVYVPYYDPWVVYGTWWWPAYPPVYWAPWPGYVYPGVSVGIYWGTGIVLSTNFFFGTFDWHRHQVDVVYVNNHYYHPRVTHSAPLPWHHEVQHRRGVPYRQEELRRRYPEPVRQYTPRTAPRAPDITRPAQPQRQQQFQQQHRAAPQQGQDRFRQQQQQQPAPRSGQQQQRTAPQSQQRSTPQYRERTVPQSQQRSAPSSERGASGSTPEPRGRDAPDAGRGGAPGSGGRDR